MFRFVVWLLGWLHSYSAALGLQDTKNTDKTIKDFQIIILHFSLFHLPAGFITGAFFFLYTSAKTDLHLTLSSHKCSSTVGIQR